MTMTKATQAALLAFIATFLIRICPLSADSVAKPNLSATHPARPIIILTPTAIKSVGSGFFSPAQIYGGWDITVGRVQWGGEDPQVTSLTDSSWSTLKVPLSVRCILSSGCNGLSVMDFALVCGDNMAVVLYGSQEEFGKTDLIPGESTSGSITFAVPPGSARFSLRYAPKPIAVAEFSK